MIDIRYERQKRIDSMPVDTEHDLLIKRIVEARTSIGREAMRQVFESKDLTALRQNLMDYVTEQGHWLRSSMDIISIPRQKKAKRYVVGG